MSKSWRQACKELTDFIAEHPEVEIKASKVSTPENVRPEFYRLFNATRTAFVEEKSPDLLNEATVLSTNYLKAEQEVTELLGLEEVSMMASLGRFLHDPTDGLRRGLFGLLFDLLKGKVDIGTFEAGASRNIEASFGPLYKLGYEKWVALSLIQLLEADKSFQVNQRKLTAKDEEECPTEGVPSPEESKRLSFAHGPDELFIIPDFIVHSAKVDRYIALKSQIGEAQASAYASNASEQREWYPLYSMPALEPGLALVYVADKPEEISLVAEAKKICRPDLIIECRGQKDWYEKEGLEKVKLHNDSLKPTLGTYIVSGEPVPEQEPEKREEGIHILTVGFDQSKLEPIISILMNQENKGQ